MKLTEFCEAAGIKRETFRTMKRENRLPIVGYKRGKQTEFGTDDLQAASVFAELSNLGMGARLAAKLCRRGNGDAEKVLKILRGDA